MMDMVQMVRATGAEASRHVALLMESPEPVNQASGLALLAGMGMPADDFNLAGIAPETWLAAVDLCEALFGGPPARALLGQWVASVGGARTAGETAHTLLFESRLPHGGGSTALDLMISVNDPQAIQVGLRLVAADAGLPPSVRTEALIRLRAYSDFETYQEFARFRFEEARRQDDGWAVRAGRLLERLDGPPAVVSRPWRVDQAWVDDAMDRSYPGSVEDVEQLLRHGVPAGWVEWTADSAALLREAIAQMDESTLGGPDRAAWERLRRRVDPGN